MASSHIFYTFGANMAKALITSVTSAATGYPKEYLTAFNPDTYWKPTSTANQTLTFDLGSAKSIGAVLIFCHNWTTDHGNSGNATVLLEHSDNGSSWTSTSTEVLGSSLGTSNPMAQFAFVGLPLSHRYWRLTFGTMATTIELSGVFFCTVRSVSVGNLFPQDEAESYAVRSIDAAGGRTFRQGINRNESFEYVLSFRISGNTNFQALQNAYRDCFGELYPLIWLPSGDSYKLVRFSGKFQRNEKQYQYYEPEVRLVSLPYAYPGEGY